MRALTAFTGRFGRKIDLNDQVTAYRAVFVSALGRRHVLPDLAEFCGVGRPLPHDPVELQRAAGRRDVWDHIQTYLHFPEAEVYAVLKGEPIVRQQDE